MAKRRLRKPVKYTLILIIIGIIGVVFYKCSNRVEPKKEDNIKKEEKIVEEVHYEYERLINDKGIFSKYYELAYNRLASMSLDEKIAQILLVRVPNDDEIIILGKYQFGGYLLFGKDVNNITKEELINKINSYQSVSRIPIIVAIDEEGGNISRINSNTNIVSEPFLSPMELYNNGGLELIEKDIEKKNALLEELGINLNLAPVVDIASEGTFIYNRTLGQDSSVTSTYAAKVIEVSKRTRVSYVLKHFPGYGDNVDTHVGLAIDDRELEEFEKKDFLPFISGINNGAECILVSHNILSKIDDNIPASLSKKVHDILRDNLSFTGIIITDDLYMDAIKMYQEKPSIAALEAGNDLIIITDYENGINDIKESINDSNIDILDRAVLRVLAWKYYKGLLK